MLDVQHLTVRLGGRDIVEDVSFAVTQGEWLMLAGPNGAGKSTVVGAVSRTIPYEGAVLLDGTDTKKCKPQQLARRMAVLTQRHDVGYDFSVEEVVALGRYAYGRGMLAPKNAEDDAQIERALTLTGLQAMRRQSVLTLSGGELQRTFLAQVFAQDPQLLILDEPANHLDLKYQQQLFELIAAWVKEPNRAVLSVVHDLSLARAFGTSAVLMKNGRILSQGAMEEVFTPKRLEEAYDMKVDAWMRSLLARW